MLYTLTYRPHVSVSGAGMRLSVDLMEAALVVTQKPQPLITTAAVTRAEALYIFLLFETINVSTSLFP